MRSLNHQARVRGLSLCLLALAILCCLPISVQMTHAQAQASSRPTITSLSPASVKVGHPAFDLTVRGSNFVVGSKIRWNNQERDTTLLSSTQLRAAILASDLATPGAARISMRNPESGEGSSNEMRVEVGNPPPLISCLSPSSAPAGKVGITLTVYGLDFVVGSKVCWNNKERATAFISRRHLTATIPASDIASPGTANITVVSPGPGGGSSSGYAFAIFPISPGAPLVTGSNPSWAPAGSQGFVLTVKGTGFVPGSQVQWNGSNRETTFIGSTQLKALIPASDLTAGCAVTVTVSNPASSADLSFEQVAAGEPPTVEASGKIFFSYASIFTIINPIPVIAGLSPSSARAGTGAVICTINGSGFVDSSIVQWNGNSRPTTFVSSSQLKAEFQASDIAAESTASVTVSSAAPSGGTSHSQTFTITTSIPTRTTLFYPRLVSTDGSESEVENSEYTGIVVANLAGRNAILTVTAYDRSGERITGIDITNPLSATFSAGEQLPIVDSQIFGAGLLDISAVGWVKIESTVDEMIGFFLMFNRSLSALDGAGVSAKALTSFILPEIEDQGFTHVHVANPDRSPAAITFELTRSNGTQRAIATRNVNGNGTVAETFTQLFPGETPLSSDYIRVTSNQGVVPFEYLGKTGQYAHGLNGQDADAGATTLYSPQYAVGGTDWHTTLSVVNLSMTPGEVAFRFIRDDGTQVGETRTLQIPARGKLHIGDQKFFTDPGSDLLQGYVEIMSNGVKLAGDVVFGDPNRSRFSSALPLVSELKSSVVFSHVASNATYFTGVALLNPSNTDSTAKIEVYDRNGNLVRSKTELIQARRRKSLLLTDYFSDLVGQTIDSGYIRVTADRGLVGFALFGTHDLSVLSAIPPQVLR